MLTCIRSSFTEFFLLYVGVIRLLLFAGKPFTGVLIEQYR